MNRIHLLKMSAGFTLVEMLVGVIMSAILAAGVGFYMHSVMFASSEQQAFSMVENINSISYHLRNDLTTATGITTPPLYTDTATVHSLVLANGITYAIVNGALMRTDESGSSENLLKVWDKGRIFAESLDVYRSTDLGGAIDVDPGTREEQMVWVSLKLSHREEDSQGNEGTLFDRTFSLEVLPGTTPGRLK